MAQRPVGPRRKVLALLLVVTSLCGYLEWGGGNHGFLFEAEYEVLKKLFTDPLEAIHPFTLIPLFGQLVLLLTLFQKTPSRALMYLGLACLGLLLGLVFLIGLLGMNYTMLASTLPFMATAVAVVWNLRR